MAMGKFENDRYEKQTCILRKKISVINDSSTFNLDANNVIMLHERA